MTKIGLCNVRHALMVTVSATAIFLSVEGTPVRADETMTPGSEAFWVSVTGMYSMWDGGKPETFADPRYPLNSRLGDGIGLRGAVGIRVSPNYDVVGRIKYNKMSKVRDSSSFYYSYSSFGNASGNYKEHALIGDLEIGRDVGLGSVGGGDGSLRVHAGVRIGHFNGSSDASYSSFYNGQQNSKRKFTGAGPRIGFNASILVAESVNFDLGAAGAVLFGKQKFSVNGTYSGYNFGDSRKKSVVVPNVEASAALRFLLGAGASVSLGYTLDAYFGVQDDGHFSRKKDDRVIHGPFVKFTIGGG